MRYALVDGLKMEPFTGGRGYCPLCGLEVKAHCGPMDLQYWRHVSEETCDDWSEPLRPWHRVWQDFVEPAHAEVSKKGRRADLVGDKNVVVELQYGSLSADEIKTREAFYGSMVWVFDASCFAAVRTGTTAFFSYGPDDYPLACSKLMFLDFGTYLVQVTRHTETFAMCSGYGTVRSHKWFAQQLLSDALRPSPEFALGSDEGGDGIWKRERPYWVTQRPVEWFMGGKRVSVPAAEPYIILNYSCPKGDTFVWRDVVEKHPDLANGWTLSGLERMRTFLRADAVILRGGLRLLPTIDEDVSYSTATKSQTRLLLVDLEKHIKAGRIPVLEESLKDHLLRIARSDRRF